MPLPNPFRPATTRPSLKARAATLRANLSAPASAPTTMPAPGSEEAMAAFHAACRQHTIRTQFANEYPDLKRTSLEWWTADTLSKAMESGEITPTECARLVAPTGAYDRAAIMAAAVEAAKAHQTRTGAAWAASMSVGLTAAWMAAKAARAAAKH